MESPLTKHRRRQRTFSRLFLIAALLPTAATFSSEFKRRSALIRPFSRRCLLCATDSSELSKQAELKEPDGFLNSIVSDDHSSDTEFTSLTSKIAEKAGDALDSLMYCAVNLDDLSAPWTSRMDSESTFVEYTEDGVCIPAGAVGQFKEKLANFLAEPIVEVSICASVLISSGLIAVSTLDTMMPYMNTIRMAENFIGIIFAIEFFGRWFSSSKETGRHIFNPQFALDVVVVILPLLFGMTPASFWADTWVPNWVTSPSSLINLELLRVLRLQRVLQDLDTFIKFERALGIPSNSDIQEWQLQLARVLLSIFTLLSVASGMIYSAEHDANPAMTDYFTALYFGLTTLTTVGFGDITPVTWGGKVVVCGSILAGVAIIPAQAAALVEALLARKQAANARTSSPSINPEKPSVERMVLDTATTCSNCGSSMHWENAKFCYSCGNNL